MGQLVFDIKDILHPMSYMNAELINATQMDFEPEIAPRIVVPQ